MPQNLRRASLDGDVGSHDYHALERFPGIFRRSAPEKHPFHAKSTIVVKGRNACATGSNRSHMHPACDQNVAPAFTM
jgi:hypothetical protein